MTIEQAKLTHKELSERSTPELLPPLRMTAAIDGNVNEILQASPISTLSCKMNSPCFDWSRCPVSSGFPVYIYENSMIKRDDGWVFSVGKKSGYYTKNPDEACLFVVPGKIRCSLLPRK